MRKKRSTRCASCIANPHNRPYITMWNTISKRKVAGTAAPCQAELVEYLRRHEHIQVYDGQDSHLNEKKLRKREKERERRKKERKRKALKTDLKQSKGPIVTAVATAGDGLHTDEKIVEQQRNTKALLEWSDCKPPILPIPRALPALPEVLHEKSPNEIVIPIHPFAHVALAQKIWALEADAARARHIIGGSESEEENKELEELLEIRRRFG